MRSSRMWLWLCGALAAMAIARPTSLAAQATGEITGVVRSTDGQPIAGATVNVLGTARTALAGTDGRYTLAGVPAGTRSVRARFLGYTVTTQQVVVPAGGSVTADFTLGRSAVQLNAMVAVGYGEQKKVNLTGAVATVSPQELDKRPVPNLTEALQGTAPGLTIVDRAGRPGTSGTMVFIRGRGTLNNTAPLILIDGVDDDINTLDPNDIASISVLKDASSAAIYGSRAANGVILITTKRGASSKSIRWSYNGYYGQQSVEKFPQMLDPRDYLNLINEAYVNGGRAPKYSQSYIDQTVLSSEGKLPADSALKYPWTNWIGVLWHPAPMSNQTLSTRGGSDIASFSLSLNDMNQKGMIPQTDADRYALRLNTDYHPTKKLSTGLDIALRKTGNERPHNLGGVLWNMFHDTPPTTEARYPDGTYGWSANGNNPLAYAQAWGAAREDYLHSLINARADYQLLPGLFVRTQASGQVGDYEYKDWQNRATFHDYWNPTIIRKSISQNYLNQTKNTDDELYGRALLDYAHDFGRNGVTAMAGAEQTQHHWSGINESRQNFYNNQLEEINAGDPTMQSTSGSSNDWGLRSGFGRLGYNYAGKYLLEGNARYDGSSKFAPGHRYGFFPSFSAGWRISEESWFKDRFAWVDQLKLRGSWGRMGNQDAQNDLYPYWSLIGLGSNYVFGGQYVVGASKNSLANQDITWESTQMSDGGIDATFLGGRLDFTGDVYRKYTSNILQRLPIPEIIGLGAPMQNKLKVRNTGWEAMVGWRDHRGGFGYSANFNIAHNNNVVTDLAGSGPYISGIWITQVGLPLGTMFGYRTAGLFQTDSQVKAHAYQSPQTGVGDIVYVDQNHDGKIDAADRVPIGCDMPKYTFGSTLTADWKGFDISGFFQGAWKVSYWVQGALVEGPFWENYTSTIWQNRWTPQTPNGYMPKPTIFTSHDQQASDYWVFDASYVKLKNVQLGYTLPKRIDGALNANRLRLYVSGQNMLTFTRNSMMVLDPENNSGRANDYPQVRIVSVGVSANY